MTHDERRLRVLRARVEFDQSAQQLAARWQLRRDWFDRHRLALLIGGGLLSGLALASVTPKRWSGVGAALFGGGAWLARSEVGPAIFAALWTSVLSSVVEAHRPAADQSATGEAGSAPPNL